MDKIVVELSEGKGLKQCGTCRYGQDQLPYEGYCKACRACKNANKYQPSYATLEAKNERIKDTATNALNICGVFLKEIKHPDGKEPYGVIKCALKTIEEQTSDKVI